MMHETPQVSRRLLAISDVSAALGVGRTVAWRLVRSGELRSVRIGRRRLVEVAELERYIARLREAGV